MRECDAPECFREGSTVTPEGWLCDDCAANLAAAIRRESGR